MQKPSISSISARHFHARVMTCHPLAAWVRPVSELKEIRLYVFRVSLSYLHPHMIFKISGAFQLRSTHYYTLFIPCSIQRCESIRHRASRTKGVLELSTPSSFPCLPSSFPSPSPLELPSSSQCLSFWLLTAGCHLPSCWLLAASC